jgi:cytochrome c oxidase cbb3-type subunit III
MARHPQTGMRFLSLGGATGVLALMFAAGAAAQAPQPPSGLPKQPPLLGMPLAGQSEAPAQQVVGVESYAGGDSARKLLGTPVTGIFPGNVAVNPQLKNPTGDDPQAIQRGMQYFTTFNCVGCHAPNGAGGIGPSLSGRPLLYGAEPAQIYLTIYQGRPRGMPAWGAMLPDNIIWDLVAYIRNIGRQPKEAWGQTISAQHPNIEQVPAEYFQSANPWSQTEAFSRGQKPNRTR